VAGRRIASAGRALRALFISYIFVRQSEPEDLLPTISELLSRARNSSTRTDKGNLGHLRFMDVLPYFTVWTLNRHLIGPEQEPIGEDEDQ
jgi:hypothetical protein